MHIILDAAVYWAHSTEADLSYTRSNPSSAGTQRTPSDFKRLILAATRTGEDSWLLRAPFLYVFLTKKVSGLLARYDFRNIYVHIGVKVVIPG